MNPVVMLMYNRTEAQLELSKESLASVFAQDIGDLHVIVVNNGSAEPTREWLDSIPRNSRGCLFEAIHLEKNVSPVSIHNRLAERLFLHNRYILSLSNDAILIPNTYREMLRWPRCMVSISGGSEKNLPVWPEVHAVDEHMPTVVALVRRWLYEAIVDKYGYYLDEGFFMYANDCDFILRVVACGLRGVKLDLPYYHYGSASHRLSTPEVSKEITDRADKDREYFALKWGFSLDSADYARSAASLDFKGVPQEI